MRIASWAEIADGVVVTVVGEVDFGTAGDLMAVVAEIFAERSPAVVRVDVRAMPFIDSTGLSALISLYRAALAADSRLVLLDPAPFLVTLLRITGLVELFPVEMSTTGTGSDAAQPDGGDHRDHRPATHSQQAADTVPTDTVPTEAVPTEAVPTEAAPTEAVLTEAVLTDTVPTAAVLARTVPADTTLTETALRDTVLGDAALTDTLLADTVPGDTRPTSGGVLGDRPLIDGVLDGLGSADGAPVGEADAPEPLG